MLLMGLVVRKAEKKPEKEGQPGEREGLATAGRRKGCVTPSCGSLAVKAEMGLSGVAFKKVLTAANGS